MPIQCSPRLTLAFMMPTVLFVSELVTAIASLVGDHRQFYSYLRSDTFGAWVSGQQ